MRSISAQRHRMNRVVNHARTNVADTLTLEALADVACLSKFHFSRVFDAHFNETPAQFVSRIRLELAAQKLAYLPDHTITQIAMDCGFSGSDTFARSFRERFKSSPRSFRAANQWSFDTFDGSHPYRSLVYRPDAEPPELGLHPVSRSRSNGHAACRIAYIRHVGPYGDVEQSISNTFAMLQRWAALKGTLRKDSSFVGLSYDSCSTTPARRCVYDAGLELTDDIDEDDVVSVQTLPAATLAVLARHMQDRAAQQDVDLVHHDVAARKRQKTCVPAKA